MMSPSISRVSLDDDVVILLGPPRLIIGLVLAASLVGTVVSAVLLAARLSIPTASFPSDRVFFHFLPLALSAYLSSWCLRELRDRPRRLVVGSRTAVWPEWVSGGEVEIALADVLEIKADRVRLMVRTENREYVLNGLWLRGAWKLESVVELLSERIEKVKRGC